jgi:hypothetical protein
VERTGDWWGGGFFFGRAGMNLEEDIGILGGIRPTGDTGLLKEKRKQEEDVEMGERKQKRRFKIVVVGST